MALTQIGFVATMLDGTEHPVTCINIDLVAWDRHRAKYALPPPTEAGFLWTNFMCWHVLKREGAFTGTLGEFEAACLGIESAPGGNGDGVTDVDPTNVAPELE